MIQKKRRKERRKEKKKEREKGRKSRKERRKERIKTRTRTRRKERIKTKIKGRIKTKIKERIKTKIKERTRIKIKTRTRERKKKEKSSFTTVCRFLLEQSCEVALIIPILCNIWFSFFILGLEGLAQRKLHNCSQKKGPEATESYDYQCKISLMSIC